MTQKELLYLEDAIGHEKNIKSICNDIISKLSDENLITFFEEEVNKHENTYNKLIRLLEDKSNEW